MLKNKKSTPAISAFRGWMAFSIILMIVGVLFSGCANVQQYDTAEFSAMEMPSDAVGYQPDGIDMEVYGVDY